MARAELTTPSMPPRPAWLERAMKLARKARTSDSETVATTTSTWSTSCEY